jgi:long-chain acyl-CoA synthetase
MSSVAGHCPPTLLIASRALMATALALQARVPAIEQVVILDGEGDDGAVTWLRRALPRAAHAPVPRRAGETALVVYTSGTTGSAKGVEITFGNLQFQSVAVDRAIGRKADERFLSVLPLNHLYELICGLVALLRRGATISYSESLLPDDLKDVMREERITSLVGVPLLFRALKRGIERGMRQQPRARRALLALIGLLARLLPWNAARRALHAPVLKHFGGSLRAFYCGGAALDLDVALFFERLGIPVYQGYGLSETSPVISTNSPRANRLGSDGRPLDGVEVRIEKKSESDPEGEILTRGPHVMRGYLYRADLTAEMLDEQGWLHTGDLGCLDDDGYLYVTGRCKDLIVLGGGKKVHPDEVEELLAQSTAFKEVCVLGAPSRSPLSRGFDEVCAVVVPAAEMSCDVARDGEALQLEMQAEVARLAARLAQFKRPTRVVVRRESLPITATRKLKRPVLRRWLACWDEAKEKME